MRPTTILMKKMTKTVIGDTVSGVVKNFFNDDIRKVEKYLSNMPITQEKLWHQKEKGYQGIHDKHKMYPWFMKTFFSKIQNHFDTNLKLLSATYLDEYFPLTLHSDYYHSYGNAGTPKYAMLIPLSVDNDTTSDKKVYTVIFDQPDLYVDDAIKSPEQKDIHHSTWRTFEWVKNRRPQTNNAVQYKQQYLSHLNDEDLECLTVQNILEWCRGDLIYWDERLLHASDNFIVNGIKSKQAIIIHTYVL
jgi:hypothetical protein